VYFCVMLTLNINRNYTQNVAVYFFVTLFIFFNCAPLEESEVSKC
jgi:hypothetical protein